MACLTTLVGLFPIQSGGRRRRSGAGGLFSGALTVALLAVAAAPGWAAVEDGQWWRIQWDMDRVWQISDGSGITVAVIDSRVDSIPQLSGALQHGADFTEGYVGDDDAEAHAFHHGTGVASLIAGRNDPHFSGVAPGASILSVVVSPFGGGPADLSRVHTRSLRYAVDNGADVVNISMAVPLPCPTEYVNALQYAADNDVVVVAGSGNEPVHRAPYPGSCPGLITVGATDRNMDLWSQSKRSEHVDLAAAGVGVSVIGADGEVMYANGTSLSTALVSGVAALIRSAHPTASADEVIRRLLHTADDSRIPGWNDATGYGVVNPYGALTEPLPPDVPNPVYDALFEATGDGQPTMRPPMVADASPSAPERETGRILLVLAIGGLLFLFLVGGAILLAVTLGRTRRRPPRAAHTAAYPYPRNPTAGFPAGYPPRPGPVPPSGLPHGPPTPPAHGQGQGQGQGPFSQGGPGG